MENTEIKNSGSAWKSYSSPAIIALALVAGIVIYVFVMGNPENFEGGNPANHPKAGNVLGLMYKGGKIVPIAMGIFLMLITFSIERIITLLSAAGKGSMDVFVHKIQNYLEQDNIEAAMAECDTQKGSVGNVIKATLRKYKEMSKEQIMDKEQKILAIQKSLEEATALELPMLEKNLTIIATIVSIGTLIGLIGTVLGMIAAFSALATAGAPDAVALANGISEALINTAIGITTSTIATIAYNYFTSSIDTMSYRIDEAGYSIVQTFGSKY